MFLERANLLVDGESYEKKLVDQIGLCHSYRHNL